MKKHTKSFLIIPFVLSLAACSQNTESDKKEDTVNNKADNKVNNKETETISLKEKLETLVKDESYMSQFDLREDFMEDEEDTDVNVEEEVFEGIPNKAGDSYLWFYYDVGSIGDKPLLTLTSGKHTVWLSDVTEEQIKEFEELNKTNTDSKKAAIEGYYNEKDEFVLGTPSKPNQFLLGMHDVEVPTIIPKGEKTNFATGSAKIENMRLSTETGVTITVKLENDETVYPILIGEKTVEDLFYIENENTLFKVVYFEVDDKGYFMFGDKDNLDKLIKS